VIRICCEYRSRASLSVSIPVPVGTTLGQKDASGNEHPLAFVSQKLMTTQCRWSTIEREAYAIGWALGRFRQLIFGSRIVVLCDHNPLNTLGKVECEIVAVVIGVGRIDLDIKYTKGSENVVADYLSRM